MTNQFLIRLAMTLCDCELDLLDLQVEYSNQFDAEDTPSFGALRTTSGIIPYAGIVTIVSILVCLAIIVSEEQRRRKAKQLAEAYASSSTIWASLF